MQILFCSFFLLLLKIKIKIFGDFEIYLYTSNYIAICLVSQLKLCNYVFTYGFISLDTFGF